ncbi:hypothetical protein EUTSA_v10010958mg [Eutrema salsugineum]|uniref:MATH domain-containing protein n=1 Tax=Eutrema salsugineum TaxID=72664 RepID=V4LZ29_EUTSA|nr:hypothetical protein EUTSA_v10010958mg [Eutrema salsugineum]
MYLEVADHGSLPFGWKRHVRYLINLVNQNTVKDSKLNGLEWFDEHSFRSDLKVFPMKDILNKESGFLVNGELKIVAEVEVLEVIGKLDVAETTLTIVEDVYGFQILSSQVEVACHMFERHPEIASEFRSKNPNLRTGYMSLLLGLIETLCQSPHELHKADLAVAYDALRSLTYAGFKLDWLEKKLDEMSEKKEKEEAGEIRMQEIDEELKHLKQK